MADRKLIEPQRCHVVYATMRLLGTEHIKMVFARQYVIKQGPGSFPIKGLRIVHQISGKIQEATRGKKINLVISLLFFYKAKLKYRFGAVS